ncbi:MAG: hypothetical protein KDC71_12390 [Acidobacteria bacterium]|nr:hypothetical protein [Acidobacteriota bacterium]
MKHSSSFYFRIEIRWSLIYVAILMVSGCSSSSEWETLDEANPFLGTDKLAISQKRFVSDWSTIMSPTGDRTERRWSDGADFHISKNNVANEIEHQLLATQYFRSLPESQETIIQGGKSLFVRINTHRLYLVSLNPTLLVLCPIQPREPIKFPIATGGIRQILGTPRNGILGIHGLIEPLFSGIQVPFDEQVLWYAPSLGGEPRPLTLDEKGAVILRFEKA